MRRILPFLFFIFLLGSCSEYQKVLKGTDSKAKYDLAEKYYNDGEYAKANRLFEQIAPKYIGKPQGERVLYFFADSYFKIGDYNMAGYQFERFLKSYSKSDKAVEAAYMGAKSYYELSPRYSLDQTDTDKALQKLQLFINTYPESSYLEDANKMAKELTTKKEQKAFEIAKQYNTLGEFDYTILPSAIASLDNFMSDFPGSIYREDALYYKIEATTNIALNSYESKKMERLHEARIAYETLLKYFPESKYKAKADFLLQKINNATQNLSK